MKLRYLPLLLLLSAFASASAQGYHRISQVISRGSGVQANVSPYAKITVCVTGTNCATQQAVYSNIGLTNQISQPVVADGNGNYDYYVAAGCVDEQISYPGATSQITPNVCFASGVSGGVTSLNTLVGALSVTCGSGLTCTSAGSTINISLSTVFSITSFTGGETVEVGTSIPNPVFTASYSSTPNSASITNTESIDSPLALTTPFTLGTVVGTFVHNSVTTTTFTLTATQGATTQTMTQALSWQDAIFGGVGTAGATSSVTSSGTTAILSNSNVLARAQLGAETIGQTLGTYSPSNQVIYLLLIGGSHTFVDAGTGFPMAFNTPTAVSFVTVTGVTVPMYLYRTTNALYSPSTPKVTS